MTSRLCPIVLIALGACITPQEPPPGGGGWGSGNGGGNGSSGFGCHQDAECGASNVCARDGECLLASEVYTAHVTWTLKGAAASTATCSSSPDLDITFGSASDSFGFSPVPCVEGKFTIDKLPLRYANVSLVRTGSQTGGASGLIDRSTGLAALDLPY